MSGQKTVGTRTVSQPMKKQPQKEGAIDSNYAGAVEISKGSGVWLLGIIVDLQVHGFW